MKFKKYTYYLLSIGRLLTGIKPWSRVFRIFLKLPAPARSLIELRESGIKLKVRGVMDIWSVKETFLDRFYEKFGAPIENGWTIMDIGGGIGDFTLFALLNCPQNRVFVYEPFPDSFALLQENLRLNRVSNVQAFPKAVWSQTGFLAIDTSIGEPGQHISRSAETSSSTVKNPIVPSVSLSDAFVRLGTERCDLMKLDCEGAEYPILFNAPETILDRIERMVMEYHDNVSGYTHRDLVQFLTDKGFDVNIHPNSVHNYLGYLYAYRG